MPRPPVERILGSAISARGFRPSGPEAANAVPAPGGESVGRLSQDGTDESAPTTEIVLSLDEAEALRLADLEGLYQQAASQRMGVSRQTFGRIIESARRKTSDALLNGKALRIAGGPVAISTGSTRPSILALPTNEAGALEEHFGHSQLFTLFSIGTDGSIQSERRFDVHGEGGCRPGLIAALAAQGVTHFVVGCIGDGGLHVAEAHGIAVLRGASGPVRAAAEAFLRGELCDSSICCDPGSPAGRGRTCRNGGPGCPGRGRR